VGTVGLTHSRRVFLEIALNRRHFLSVAGAAAGGILLAADSPESSAGETLYNGIRLPSSWPPKQTPSREPMAVPYLKTPPAVIPIDVGRQLFFDDFLIDQTTLHRTFHAATYHPDTPILKPDQKWEQTGQNPCAMVFSDGVWHDPKDALFKMWYMGGIVRSTCYATSKDGVHWDKPILDVAKDTNIVEPHGRDSSTIWLDLEEKDPKRRFKMFRVWGDDGWAISLHFSADGIHWDDAVARSGPCGDRTTVFYNPFRKVWVFGVRIDAAGVGRARAYVENGDVLAGARWKSGEPNYWCSADKLDPQRDDLKTPPQLYNLDAIAYESVLLGLFSIWRGQPRDRAKPNEVCIGFSRDGFHWHRPERQAFLPVSETHGDWNWGNVQSAGGCCLVVGDKLYFYVSGRAGVKGTPLSGVCTTGLATLRRDGFASLDAGKDGGTLTTRPVTFKGKHLFVNADVGSGELTAEVLDERGRVIEGFAQADCVPLRADKTRQAVVWKSGDLAKVAGKPVKFRFHLKNGKLFAFWVSPEKSGASHGYVAAGGPGFTGPTDTVGSRP
jgi:hypothetical protein